MPTPSEVRQELIRSRGFIRVAETGFTQSEHIKFHRVRAARGA